MPFISPINYNDSRPYRWKIDYGSRTDGQPVYQGFAEVNTTTAQTDWLIYYFTYDINNQTIGRNVAYGSWDNRTELTYA